MQEINRNNNISFVISALNKCKLKALEGIKKGENPFGACVIVDKEIITCTYDLAMRNNNPADHAEVVAIYTALRKLDVNQFPKGAILISTCEPCPICMTVAQLAGIEYIYYGMSVTTGKKRGYLKYSIPSSGFASQLGSNIKIVSLEKKCSTEELIDFWESRNDS
ncbi:nucleoside deaminase [Brenneria rubrifaciens]|uniref:Nucleoside deaminase n=1 Tax=Brenneria rubrifaciens TaxID=55213 RepID=A0A4P8QVD1_9GAMM|nr:nucleoside deaminase [Brenneria rubrifaciens]QCR08125.1 nucleoside deaminase [Brenneria rubrifaciens]